MTSCFYEPSRSQQNFYDSDFSERQLQDSDKRAGRMMAYDRFPEHPFNSWAGKRKLEMDDLRNIGENIRLVKRQSLGEYPDYIRNRRFSRELRDLANHRARLVFRPARATFSAWGGK